MIEPPAPPRSGSITVSSSASTWTRPIRTAATTDRWRNIVKYEDEPIVSTDVSYSTYSSTFDSLATMVLGGNVSKTLSWYDAGYGYAHRAVDLIERFATLDARRDAA